jgi:cytochrome c oxidase cbb3-type subunit 3
MRCHLPAALRVGILALALAACDREERRFREAPPGATPSGAVQLSTLKPGVATRPVELHNAYDENAYAVSEGERRFNSYNCAGCHAHGGGGMGPPLIDDEWIYGSAPENIYETIVEGRPNGMPSFGGRIPSYQIWQLVAYVRSLSALTPSGTRSSRTDHMMMFPGSRTLQRPEQPKQSTRPPASEMPPS